MSEFSNGLTLAEQEILYLTAEENSEVTKACMKICRHGLFSGNRAGTQDNQMDLEEELGDVLACIRLLEHNRLINLDNVQSIAESKLRKMKDPSERRVHFLTPEMVPEYYKEVMT